MYSAEHQLIKAMPKMVKAADKMRLRNALAMHLTQTEEHAQQLGYANMAEMAATHS